MKFTKDILKGMFMLLVIFGLVSLLFAEEIKPGQAGSVSKKDTQAVSEIKRPKVKLTDTSLLDRNLTPLQTEARLYRKEGYKLQSIGDLDGAMSMYQKAIELDPSYTVVYNDLGIIYEANGWIDRAELCYLEAIRLDPNYLSAYSNLASLYEGKQDLEKAAFYWKKRMALGSSEDPWTKKAEKRYYELIQVVPALRQELIEREAFQLLKEASEKKRIENQQKEAAIKKQIEAANKFCSKAQYKEAIDELNKALSIKPDNKELIAMLDKVKLKLKEQEKEAARKQLEKYFKDGLKYYEQGNIDLAKKEFKKLVELTVSPQEQ